MVYFGTGEVSVQQGITDRGGIKVPSLILSRLNSSNEVGAMLNQLQVPPSENIVLSFTSLASFDVVIESLIVAKRNLRTQLFEQMKSTLASRQPSVVGNEQVN